MFHRLCMENDLVCIRRLRALPDRKAKASQSDRDRKASLIGLLQLVPNVKGIMLNELEEDDLTNDAQTTSR